MAVNCARSAGGTACRICPARNEFNGITRWQNHIKSSANDLVTDMTWRLAGQPGSSGASGRKDREELGWGWGPGPRFSLFGDHLYSSYTARGIGVSAN